MNEIRSYSHPLTNRKVLELIEQEDLREKHILDVGAGEGYFCQSVGDLLLRQYGLSPSDHLWACDLFPENFRYAGIACDRTDFHHPLPYEDDQFDLVIGIEVIEHLEDPFAFLRELHRVAKPGGKVIVTTPNILNINSRLRHFTTGFGLLFNVLPIEVNQPVHTGGHIHPISLYYLGYAFHRAGFPEITVHYDRTKRSSVMLSLPFYPLIQLFYFLYRSKLARRAPALFEQNRYWLKQINSWATLTSRTIILAGVKA